METFWEDLGIYREPLAGALAQAEGQRIIQRVWEGDYTLWSDSPEEITNRLGWLKSPEGMISQAEILIEAVEAVRFAGYKTALLFGMGGSSLAPRVFARIFGPRPGYLDLSVIDSTDPATIQRYADSLNPAETLFIVSTKSGGTIETLSLFKYFYNLTRDRLGAEEAGRHFIAITDPGSSLADLAQRHHFRKVIVGDPDIGGRYSAISPFGLFPAALLGIDIRTLVLRARDQAKEERELAGERFNGALLGFCLGELALLGRDKVTLVLPPAWDFFALWLEQLLAESSGKKGRGLLPVWEEGLRDPSTYGDDRVFVVFESSGGESTRQKKAALTAGGHPCISLKMDDPGDLGRQIFLWEMATAVACQRLRVNPFDQPDVEAAKGLTRKILSGEERKGVKLFEEPGGSYDGVSVYGEVSGNSSGDSLALFLDRLSPGGYVAILAYLEENRENSRILGRLKEKIAREKKVAVTLGYGPGYLHSTGQLHKGGPPGGLFICITAGDTIDLPVPDEPGKAASAITFGRLKLAQAKGDCLALKEAGRPVIRFHLEGASLVDLASALL